MHFSFSSFIHGLTGNNGRNLFFFKGCNPESKKPQDKKIPQRPAVRTPPRPVKKVLKRVAPPKARPQKLPPSPVREKKSSDIFLPSLPEARYLGERIQQFCDSQSYTIKSPDGKTLDLDSNLYYIKIDHQQLKSLLETAKEKFFQKGNISLNDSQELQLAAEKYREAVSITAVLKEKLWKCYRKKTSEIITSKRLQLVESGISYNNKISALLSDKKMSKTLRLVKLRQAWNKFEEIYKIIFKSTFTPQYQMIPDNKTAQLYPMYNRTKALLTKEGIIK